MKHKPDAGFINGEHWAVCDVCDMDYRQSELQRRWDNLLVCKYDYEPIHPQYKTRARPDVTSPVGLHRSEPSDEFTTVNHCLSTTCRSGIAISGCARAGSTYRNTISSEAYTIPSSSFGDP